MTKLNDFVATVMLCVCYLLGSVKLFTIDTDSKGHPYFGSNEIRNVTTTVGNAAYLHCQVQQLGDKAVSWIRKRDLHILTVGVLTYTSDQRFQIIRSEKSSSNWTLQIKFPQIRDSGIYECQVNTEPKMSLPFRLNVIESKAKILGSADLHVREGSSVTFTCKVAQGPHDLNTVYWYKDNKILQPLESNEIQRIQIQNTWKEALTSQLHINSVNWSDSGKYSCMPTAALPADTNLYVITGEHPAAMHHGNTNSTAAMSPENSLVWAMAVIVISRLSLR
ncbi:limbic system-associated membrane protein-like isoform X1 [Euwallacea fornicatus]|uniref:limbic system-associated membrane protein-like isoform X1 n=1 Tax=Euwallacea fornicatus TaxID=995702 RepID=UPI00338F649C